MSLRWDPTCGVTALDARAQALLELLHILDAEGYDFVTPTPISHGRVLDRPWRLTADPLRRLLGWSAAVPENEVRPRAVLRLLEAGGMLEREAGRVRSRVRISRLHGLLFLHSAYPTTAADAVFLGPDSYRFADFISRELSPRFTGEAIDLGGGCGVGAIVAARRAPGCSVVISDVNPRALDLARINAGHAKVNVRTLQADGLDAEGPAVDLIMSNPPYMAHEGPIYSTGGAMTGGQLSLDWARAALRRLKPGGGLLLYTGTAIACGGEDRLRAALERLCAEHGAALDYREIDPDVFGEELETEPYAQVERIAAVTCVITAPGAGRGAS
jgi:methylase of polypeptide subunit release factors